MTQAGNFRRVDPVTATASTGSGIIIYECYAPITAAHAVAVVDASALVGTAGGMGMVRLANATTDVIDNVTIYGHRAGVRIVIDGVTAGDLMQLRAAPVEFDGYAVARTWIHRAELTFTDSAVTGSSPDSSGSTFPPSAPPTQLSGGGTTDLTIAWSPGFAFGSTAEFVHLRYRVAGSSTWLYSLDRTPTSPTTITGLAGTTTYEVQMAQTAYGAPQSVWGPTSSWTTGTAAPSSGFGQMPFGTGPFGQ